MNVQAHIVAKTVRHEKSLRPCGHGFVDIPPDETDILQPLYHQPAYGQMHRGVCYSGAGDGLGEIIAFGNNGVNILLPLCEFAGGGDGAGEIRNIT